MQVDLVAMDIDVGGKRIARLMRGAGLAGVSRRKGTTTTRRDPHARPAPDLVERRFVAAGRDQLWVADITYIPTWAGFLYLAVVLDTWSRRIVGTTRRHSGIDYLSPINYERSQAAAPV